MKYIIIKQKKWIIQNDIIYFAPGEKNIPIVPAQDIVHKMIDYASEMEKII